MARQTQARTSVKRMREANQQEKEESRGDESITPSTAEMDTVIRLQDEKKAVEEFRHQHPLTFLPTPRNPLWACKKTR